MSQRRALALVGLACMVSPALGAASASADPIDDRLMATLTEGGTALAAPIDWSRRPDYLVRATIDSATGEVAASVRATLPVGSSATSVRLRWLPGIVADDAVVRSVVVDGDDVKPDVEESLISLVLPPRHGDEVVVDIEVAFTVPLLTAAMANDDVFDWPYSWLQYRTDDAMVLGHWFPVWIPEGLSADPRLGGRGDIGNFPAGTIRAELGVRSGVTVVTGGVRLDEDTSGGRVVYTDGAVGVRDLAVVLMVDAEQVHRRVGDVDVVVTLPRDAQGIDGVADDAATSVAVLSDAFGAYPWDELDVVGTEFTLGMEWPGMVWIGTFLLDLPRLDDLDEPGDGEAVWLGTALMFTVAHEVGHEWWHALVGNDSLTAPVVDEPLAQHSACLVMRELVPRHGEDACDVNTTDGFLGDPDLVDGRADQAVDDFGADQYVGLVYAKAPGFYRELERRYGVAATTAALAAVVDEYAFDQITSDELRAALGRALGDPAGVDGLWQRWMDEAHGAEDIVD